MDIPACAVIHNILPSANYSMWHLDSFFNMLHVPLVAVRYFVPCLMVDDARIGSPSEITLD